MNLGAFALAALVACLFTVFFQLVMWNVRPKGVQLVERAKAAGTYAVGVLVRSTFLRGDVQDNRRSNRRDAWLALYEYEVNGRRYSYRETVFNSPVEHICIYYEKGRPGRGFTEGRSVSMFGGKYLFRVLFPLLVFAAAYWFFSQVLFQG